MVVKNLFRREGCGFTYFCSTTSHGERIVMRLLDTRADLLDVTNIGFPEDIDRAFQKQYTRPNGILLVTGPTGSGKSTTLYSG